MKKRNQIIAYLLLAITVITFFSCNKGKITEYEKTIETLNSQIALLQEEIDNYKQTDQYYYQSGADEYLLGNYWEAFIWMGRLKVKFPTSPLLSGADKIIEDLKPEINKVPKDTIYKGLLSTEKRNNYGYYEGDKNSNLLVLLPHGVRIDAWFFKPEISRPSQNTKD